MSKPTNPFAFPNAVDKTTKEWGHGMTLRDYFAGQALAGIAADCTATKNMSSYVIAGWCYGLADAMLAEREKDSDA